MLEFIIKYWLEVLFSAILGLIGLGYKMLKKRQDKQEIKNQEQDMKNKAIEKGVQALLRNELIRRYREYEIKKEISILDKENIEHMFKEYKNLGGNGTVEKMYEDLLELPTKIIKS